MPEGPLGFPRPFARNDTIKVLAEMERPAAFDRRKFFRSLKSSDNIEQPPEVRVVGLTESDFVVVDTQSNSIRNSSLQELIGEINEALIGAEAGGIKGEATIVTPKQ